MELLFELIGEFICGLFEEVFQRKYDDTKSIKSKGLRIFKRIFLIMLFLLLATACLIGIGCLILTIFGEKV